MNTFLTKARRQELIDQYLDCYEETGGEDVDGMEVTLNSLSNPELVKYCEEAGWDII